MGYIFVKIENSIVQLQSSGANPKREQGIECNPSLTLRVRRLEPNAQTKGVPEFRHPQDFLCDTFTLTQERFVQTAIDRNDLAGGFGQAR